MSQQARDLLAKRAEHLTNEIGGIDQETSEIREQAKSLADQRADALDELRTVQSLQAMLGGTFVAYPRDVQSDEDILGLRIAGLTLSPQPDPSIKDLQLWQATMRTVCEHANHQIVLAADTIAEQEHRERQGDVPTGGFPAVQPPQPPYAELVGQVVVVTYLEGSQAVGRLTASGAGRLELRNAADEVMARPDVAAVESVVPFDETETTELSATRPDEPEGGAS